MTKISTVKLPKGRSYSFNSDRVRNTYGSTKDQSKEQCQAFVESFEKTIQSWNEHTARPDLQLNPQHINYSGATLKSLESTKIPELAEELATDYINAHIHTLPTIKLWKAVVSNEDEGVRSAIGDGADVADRIHGITPLLYANNFSHSETVRAFPSGDRKYYEQTTDERFPPIAQLYKARESIPLLVNQWPSKTIEVAFQKPERAQTPAQKRPQRVVQQPRLSHTAFEQYLQYKLLSPRKT